MYPLRARDARAARLSHFLRGGETVALAGPDTPTALVNRRFVVTRISTSGPAAIIRSYFPESPHIIHPARFDDNLGEVMKLGIVVPRLKKLGLHPHWGSWHTLRPRQGLVARCKPFPHQSRFPLSPHGRGIRSTV